MNVNSTFAVSKNIKKGKKSRFWEFNAIRLRQGKSVVITAISDTYFIFLDRRKDKNMDERKTENLKTTRKQFEKGKIKRIRVEW